MDFLFVIRFVVVELLIIGICDATTYNAFIAACLYSIASDISFLRVEAEDRKEIIND